MSKTRMILITIGLAVGAISLYFEGTPGKVLAGIIAVVFVTALAIEVVAHRKRAKE